MTVTDLLKSKKSEFEDAITFYHNDIASIRTGRATPALVEDIKVNVYGSEQSIKELATITSPEPKSLLIQPWDKAALEAINSAIQKSQIGINPIVDGESIRLTLPPLTEERRIDYTKVLKQKTEEARIKIRRIREEIWNKIQKMEKEGEIREDDKFSGKDDLQKAVDSYNKSIEETESKKASELMTI